MKYAPVSFLFFKKKKTIWALKTQYVKAQGKDENKIHLILR